MGAFKAIIAAVVAVIILITVLATATQIEQTERGVVTKFGAVTGTMEPGFHLVNPFTTDVKIMDVSVQALPVQGQAYSKDSQTVDFEVVVNYQLNAESVEAIYNEVQRDVENRYVIPRANDAIRGVLAQYTAQGVVEERGIIPGKIREQLTGLLEGTNISVSSVTVTNFDFDDAYEAAVRNKQVQEQEALAQVNITNQEEQKKQQEILKAEALAEKTRLEVSALQAGGDDIIRKIQAEAELARANKWNGVLPVNVYGSAPLPFLDVN